MLFVVFFEDVLLLEETEHHHRLVEKNLNFRLRQSFDALLQLVVYVKRQVFGALQAGTTYRNINSNLIIF